MECEQPLALHHHFRTNAATVVSSLHVLSSSESLTYITQVKEDLNYKVCSPKPQVKPDIRHFLVKMLAVEGNVKDWEEEVWLG